MITDVNIEVPLLNDFNTCQDYYLLYEYDPTNRPKKKPKPKNNWKTKSLLVV